METQYSYSDLQNSIKLLEEEQIIKRHLLNEQLNVSFESLKPINLFSSALKEVSKTADLRDNILGTAIGLASGFLTKRLIVGTSGNVFRKLIGSFIQLEVTNIVAKHPDTIKAVGRVISKLIPSGNVSKSGKRVV